MKGDANDSENLQFTTDIWNLVLRYIHELEDHAKAAATCKAAWGARPVLTKLEVPQDLPEDGKRSSVGPRLLASIICKVSDAEVMASPAAPRPSIPSRIAVHV